MRIVTDGVLDSTFAMVEGRRMRSRLRAEAASGARKTLE